MIRILHTTTLSIAVLLMGIDQLKIISRIDRLDARLEQIEQEQRAEKEAAR